MTQLVASPPLQPERAAAARSRWLDPAQRAALQRRTLRVLVAAQLVPAVGVSGAAAGALLALDVTGRESLASLFHVRVVSSQPDAEA